jgi:phosphoglycolate phosphatase-like HAD superfamily hydrolase
VHHLPHLRGRNSHLPAQAVVAEVSSGRSLDLILMAVFILAWIGFGRSGTHPARARSESPIRATWYEVIASHRDSRNPALQVLILMSDALLRDLAAHFAGLPPVQVLYTDLDGTLLGPEGSLLTAPDGRPSIRAAAALVAARLAGITVVPVSGRRAASLAVDARLMGLSDAIAEVGSVILRAGQRHYEWGECPRNLGSTPRETLRNTGALDALLEAFGEDLRPYRPWDAEREGGHLLHGSVDVNAANAVLAQSGFSWAQLVDNGAAGGWPGREVRSYHLIARGVGKAIAITDDLRDRGLRANQAVAIGDSLEDRTMAAAVATYVQVANGHGELGGNVFGVPGAMGDGFADVVETITATRT